MKINEIVTLNISAAPWSFILVRKNSSFVSVSAFDSSSCIRAMTIGAAYCSCWGLSGSTSFLGTKFDYKIIFKVWNTKYNLHDLAFNPWSKKMSDFNGEMFTVHLLHLSQGFPLQLLSFSPQSHDQSTRIHCKVYQTTINIRICHGWLHFYDFQSALDASPHSNRY